MYIEISNYKNNLYTDREERIIKDKTVSILKNYCIVDKFKLFYFSDGKYILVNDYAVINHHKTSKRLIKNLSKTIGIDNKKITVKFHIGAVTSKSMPTNSEELLDIIVSSCHIAKNKNMKYNLIDLDDPNSVEINYGIESSLAIISNYLSI